MPEIDIRKITTSDYHWIDSLLVKHWKSAEIVSRGKVTNVHQIPGYIAYLDGIPVGLITFLVDGNSIEIISLNSEREHLGVGTGLVNEVIRFAGESNLTRVWVITTNDNLPAITFYKKCGFKLKKIYKNAVAKSRKLKPGIPLVGFSNISVKDELEFELFVKYKC